MPGASANLATILEKDFEDILKEWLQEQADEGVRRTDLITATETEQQSRTMLQTLSAVIREVRREEGFDFDGISWEPAKNALKEISQSRMERGITPSEMSWFVASLKRPIFGRLRAALSGKPDSLVDQILFVSRVIDQLALYVMEVFQEEREALIERQQSEMTELSAPVVQIWERIVTVPLIGTLDSWRAQTVMESLLDSIVEHEAEVAIIDITGVATVDTLVAQHLLKTAAAVRLMGAECVICGISPKIAQTVVHLGVEMPNVATRGDLQGALAYAFTRIGVDVVQRNHG